MIWAITLRYGTLHVQAPTPKDAEYWILEELPETPGSFSIEPTQNQPEFVYSLEDHIQEIPFFEPPQHVPYHHQRKELYSPDHEPYDRSTTSRDRRTRRDQRQPQTSACRSPRSTEPGPQTVNTNQRAQRSTHPVPTQLT